jgi:hypothetical protein
MMKIESHNSVSMIMYCIIQAPKQLSIMIVEGIPNKEFIVPIPIQIRSPRIVPCTTVALPEEV